MLRLKCVYSAIMESPVSQDNPYHRRYKNAPHPYVIVPPLTKKQFFKPDDLISFEIVLIGRVNEYLPYFIYGFTEMGRIGVGKDKGKFEVVSVEAIALNGARSEIFNGINLRPSENRIDYNDFMSSSSSQPSPVKEKEKGAEETFDGDEITISFETPVRIKRDDRLAADIPFNLIIRRLSERAFLLAHLHCGAELEDFEEFAKGSENIETISSKLRWIDWERYSSRQQTTMKFGGLIGDIVYKGDLKRFLPLLRFGQHIHVGKATTFGLGKYSISGK